MFCLQPTSDYHSPHLFMMLITAGNFTFLVVYCNPLDIHDFYKYIQIIQSIYNDFEHDCNIFTNYNNKKLVVQYQISKYSWSHTQKRQDEGQGGSDHKQQKLSGRKSLQFIIMQEELQRFHYIRKNNITIIVQ